MQKKIIHYLVSFSSLGVLWGLSVIFVSCKKDNATPSVPAVANFTSSVNGLAVTFTNTSTSSKSNSWNFGDGSAASTAVSPSHTYTTAGTFSVVLTATGDPGTTPSTKTESVTTVASGAPATASFTFTRYKSTYTFTNTSTNGLTYSWDFGDGTAASTTASPVHTFTKTSSFNVTLTATGAAGTLPATSSQSLDVVAPCTTCPNLLLGGSFDALTDSSHWTIILADAVPYVSHQWAVTTGLPSHGSGGGFGVYNSAAANTGAMFYQQVALTAGNYQFSCDVKMDAGADAATGGLKDFYYEIYLDKPTPAYNAGDPYKNTIHANGYSGNDPTGMLAGFNGWKGTGAIPAGDGNFPELADGWDFYENADLNGLLTVEKDTVYYFLIKMGYYGGGFGKDGIVIDNLSLVKLP